MKLGVMMMFANVSVNFVLLLGKKGKDGKWLVLNRRLVNQREVKPPGSSLPPKLQGRALLPPEELRSPIVTGRTGGFD
jgi:hypothetical protein